MRRILIDNKEVDIKDCSFGLPWRHDANCYNFQYPNEYVLVKDVSKIQDKENIESLVIGCDLDDYSFILEMKNLKQLYIYSGNKLKDISFVTKLFCLQQLYIASSHIESLDNLVELLLEQKKRFDQEKDLIKRLFLTLNAVCIESNYPLDRNQLIETNVYISEVIINGKYR